MIAYWLCLRPQQWVKNLVVFVPLVFGLKLMDASLVLRAAGAFFAFSFLASATYIFNDISDMPEDQKHPAKKLRPIAAGKVSLAHVRILGWMLLAAGLILGAGIKKELGVVLLAYLALNVLYTRVLKSVVIVDVFTLALFYVLRIVAGTVVTEVPYSFWMISEMILLAMFLGFNKRRQEIRFAEKSPDEFRHVLSKYNLYFIDQMISTISSSLVVVYMFYCVDVHTVARFGTRRLIASIPFVYYGIFRYLYLMHKGKMGEDPTRVLLKDKMMQLNLTAWILVCVVAIYFTR